MCPSPRLCTEPPDLAMSAPSTTPRTVASRPRGTQSSAASPVAWAPTREIDLSEWAAVGRRLGAIGRCGQWVLGDWIRYGNVKFGERYTRAARITGYDAQTLMNMVYVASRFEISRRRESLSWSHHETLASLEPDAQDHWLSRAESERLSIADLRTELRSSRRRPKAPSAETETRGGETDALVCPSCGHRVSLPRPDDPGFAVPRAARAETSVYSRS
jgi:hypothetical protein